MAYRFVPLAAATLALGACFNPEPPSSQDDSSTGTVDVTGDSGVPPGTDDTGSSDGCNDGCTSVIPECPDDCEAMGDACNEGRCDEATGTCILEPRTDGTECDDGLYCTEGDACMAGVCMGTDLPCPSDGACTEGICDEDAEACTTAPIAEGDPCDDADPCTDDGTCVSGACEPGPDACVALDNECGVGMCNPGVGCTVMPLNEGAPCAVDDPCMNSMCMAGSCVQLGPINEGLGCEDGDFCTFGDVCLAGACAPGTAAACPENTACGNWACDEVADACVLTPQNEGLPCDDGNLCTPPAATLCGAGACIQPSGGGPLRTHLFEDFADNSASWALGPEWQIGPAMASVGGTPGADPATDHTSTADNQVAGVVIGGLASTNLHPYYYLTSPPMPVAAGDQAILGFYRWLNSDYDPFMHNTIEVWDGAAWVVVWISGPPPEISDSAWTYIQHDLSAYANDQMRVRFGFDIAQGGVYSAPSWNVDDVLVSSIACP